MTHADLFETIERTVPEGGDWCTKERACALASLVLGLRPRAIVEIGVWMGGSAIPMMLALDYLRRSDGIARTFVAIDPWSAEASARDQAAPDAQWWAGVDHGKAYDAFVARVIRHDLNAVCRIYRSASDDVDMHEIPVSIDLLSIDGNHADQAIRDVKKFLPRVPVGGIVALDDVNWSTGHVMQAWKLACSMGCTERYRVAETAILQRTAP